MVVKEEGGGYVSNDVLRRTLLLKLTAPRHSWATSSVGLPRNLPVGRFAVGRQAVC